MRKKISVILCILFALICVALPDFSARADSLTVTGIPDEIKVGETFSVSITVPKNIGGSVYVEYSKDVLKVTECPLSDVGTGLTSYTAFFNSATEKVIFETKTTGTATISVYMVDAEYSDKDPSEALPNVPKVTKTFEIINEVIPEVPKSDDNSLASLKLSSGTLSPSFQYNVTNYTATVEYDVTEIRVSAERSSDKASIASVTGDGGPVKLEVGQNTIQIVVQAENGVKATYTVVVTRKEESKPVEPEPSEGESSTDTETETDTTDPDINEVLQWNGEQLYVTDGVPTEKIPSDFESKLLVINGEQMQGLSFKKANLVVLYLNNTNGAGSLYVYDEAKKSVYPFVKIAGEQSYVMVLSPDEETLAKVPEGYEKCTLSIEGKGGVTAFQRKERTVKASEFYLLYCMNNAGEMGWYIYDTIEETFIRYFEETPSTPVGGDVSDATEWQNKYAALEKELNAAKMTQYIIIAIAAAVVIILIIVILVLALKKRGQEEDILEEEDSSEEEAKENETVVLEQKQEETVITEEATVAEETVVVEETVTEETTVEETVEEENKVEENTEEEFVVDTMTEEVKIERKPREADKTSKFSSKKDEESDLEFIDFE